MADRAGVVQIDVEPGLQGVGSKIDGYMRALRPFGFKAELDSTLARDLNRETRDGQRSLDSISTARAQGELRQLGSTADREIGRLGARSSLSSQSLLTIGAGAISVGSKILGSLKPAADAASGLNEAVSYSSVVFGQSATDIDQWSDTAAKALGQSKRQAVEGATTFATFGKAAGLAGDDLVGFSTGLVKLASDLASAKNTSPEEAITAIGAALRGESEPIRNYGVLLDEATLRQEALALGLVKTTKEALTPQQKVLAAQAAIFKQTGDAQGDFARTSDSAANSAKILSAELENAKADAGQGLLGVLSATNDVASGLLNTLGEIPGATTAIGVGIAGIGGAAVIGGTASAITGAGRALRSLQTQATGFRASVGSLGALGARSFGQLGSAIGAVGGVLAVAGIAEGVGAIANSLQDLDGESEKAMDQFAANVDGGRVKVLSAFQQMVQVEDASRSIGDVIKTFGEEVDFAGVLDTVDIEYLQQAFDKLSLAQKGALIDAAREQTAQLDKNSDAYIETTKLLDDWAEQLGVSTKAQENNSKEIDAGTGKLDRFGFKIDQAKGKYQQYADSFNSAIGIFDDAADALRERSDAANDVAEAEAEVARLQQASQPGTRDAIDAANDLADAEARVAESKRSVLAAQRDLADANRDLADLEAELAHVDPSRDPNRYRDLSEKVRDARDAQLDAQDRVLSAIESQRSAEVDLGSTRAEQAGGADALTEAEDRLTEARERQEDANKTFFTSMAAVNDALEANPELVRATFDAIDQFAAKYGLAADEVERMKKEILFVIALQQQGGAPVDLTNAGDFPWTPSTFPTMPGPKTLPGGGHGPVDSLSRAEGQEMGLSVDLAERYGAQAGIDGRMYTWSPSLKRWYLTNGVGPGRLAGGPVAKNSMYPVTEDGRPELLDLGPDGTYLMTGNNSGRVIPYPAFGGNVSAASLTPTASGTGQSQATPLATSTVIVAELRAIRDAITNLESQTFAPIIHARPDQVEEAMDQAFRSSRRQSWTARGKDLVRG